MSESEPSASEPLTATTTVTIRRPDGHVSVLAGEAKHIEVIYEPGGDDRVAIVWDGAVRQSHSAS